MIFYKDLWISEYVYKILVPFALIIRSTFNVSCLLAFIEFAEQVHSSLH